MSRKIVKSNAAPALQSSENVDSSPRHPSRESAELINVDRLTSSSFEKTLNFELNRRGYSERGVVLRHIARERIPVALETGTDRDSTSQDWQWPQFDAADRPPLADPSEITYGVPYTQNAAQAEGAIDTLWWNGGHIEPMGKAIEVYDAQQVERVPGTITEYRFPNSPRDALLFVIAQSDCAWLRDRARTLHIKGRYAEAAELYRHGIAKGDDGAQAYAGLGRAELSQRNAISALDSFSRACASAERDGQIVPELHFDLARAHAALGNRSAALDSLTRSVELGFDNPAAIEASAFLRVLENEPQFASLIEQSRRHQAQSRLSPR